MKFHALAIIFAGFLIGQLSGQTLYKNVQKSTDGNNRLVESLAVPTGKTLTAESGSTVTLSGSVGGTPTGGTLNLSNTTLALPATVSGGTSSFQPLDSDLTAIAAFASTGIPARTGSGTYSLRTLTGTAGQITVTNGDGVSGNPTLSLPSTITQTTTFDNGASTQVTAQRSAVNPSSAFLLGASSHPILGFTSDTAGGYTWGRVQSNGVEVLRVYNAGLTSNSPTAGAGLGILGGLVVNATTASTSTTTGALTVSGGAGFGGNVWATAGTDSGIHLYRSASGSQLAKLSMDGSNDSGSLAIYSAGVAKVTLRANAGGTNVLALPLSITDTTASTSTTTGALTVSGGVGVAGAGYFGGNLSVNTGSGTNTLTLRDGVIAKAAGSGFTVSSSWSPSVAGAGDLGTVSLPWGAVYSNGAITSTGATSGIGYSTGAGGTVTQTTNRTTGVTLNKVTGAITLVSAAGTTSWQSFTVTNSAVAATDTIIVNQVSGTDLYQTEITAVSAGSFRITYATTGGTTTEQPVFRFTVIKSVSS